MFCHLKPSSLVTSPPVHFFHPIKQSFLKRSRKAVSFQSNILPALQSRNFFRTKPYLISPTLPSNQIYHLFQYSRCTNLCISLCNPLSCWQSLIKIPLAPLQTPPHCDQYLLTSIFPSEHIQTCTVFKQLTYVLDEIFNNQACGLKYRPFHWG